VVVWLSPIARERRHANVRAMTEMGAQTVERLCELARRAGKREVCPDEECPLWEAGACSLESLLAEESQGFSDDADKL
jgi:hypothetical protein